MQKVIRALRNPLRSFHKVMHILSDNLQVVLFRIKKPIFTNLVITPMVINFNAKEYLRIANCKWEGVIIHLL